MDLIKFLDINVKKGKGWVATKRGDILNQRRT